MQETSCETSEGGRITATSTYRVVEIIRISDVSQACTLPALLLYVFYLKKD